MERASSGHKFLDDFEMFQRIEVEELKSRRVEEEKRANHGLCNNAHVAVDTVRVGHIIENTRILHEIHPDAKNEQIRLPLLNDAMVRHLNIIVLSTLGKGIRLLATHQTREQEAKSYL